MSAVSRRSRFERAPGGGLGRDLGRGVLLTRWLAKVHRNAHGVAPLADVVVAVPVHEYGTAGRDNRSNGFGGERIIIGVAVVGVVC